MLPSLDAGAAYRAERVGRFHSGGEAFLHFFHPRFALGTLPVSLAFGVPLFHSEHLAPSLPINADGYKHRSRADHGILSHFLIPRVDNQVGIFAIELLVEPTYRARAKTVPQSSSLIALTFLVDTPWTNIFVSAATSAFSLR